MDLKRLEDIYDNYDFRQFSCWLRGFIDGHNHSKSSKDECEKLIRKKLDNSMQWALPQLKRQHFKFIAQVKKILNKDLKWQ